MMKVLLATAGAAALLLGIASVAKAETKVGDVVPVAAICDTQETIAVQLQLAKSMGYEAASRQFETDAQNGKCLRFPVQMTAPVQEVSFSVEFVDSDGDDMVFEVVKVNEVWTVVASVRPKT